MHEVGHTLGLRHNFRGSAGITAAQLSDRDHTAEHGFGVSVMDYNPPAISLDRRLQGHYYAPTIGSYDRWAITYGYADVSASALHGSTAARAKGALATGERLDAGGRAQRSPGDRGRGVRPRPPVRERRGRRFRRARPGPDRVPLRSDGRPARLGAGAGRPDRRPLRFTGDPGGGVRVRGTAGCAPPSPSLLDDRWYALLVTTKYLGGAITSRDHLGDPNCASSRHHRPGRQAARRAGVHRRVRVRRERPIASGRASSPAGTGSLVALGGFTGGGRTGGFPGPRLGAGPAGGAARSAARPDGARPDARRGASRDRGTADGRHPRAVRHPEPTRSGPRWIRRRRATSGRSAATSNAST